MSLFVFQSRIFLKMQSPSKIDYKIQNLTGLTNDHLEDRIVLEKLLQETYKKRIRLEIRLEQVREENYKTEKQLKDEMELFKGIINSKSWFVTMPLRYLMLIIQKCYRLIIQLVKK